MANVKTFTRQIASTTLANVGFDDVTGFRSRSRWRSN